MTTTKQIESRNENARARVRGLFRCADHAQNVAWRAVETIANANGPWWFRHAIASHGCEMQIEVLALALSDGYEMVRNLCGSSAAERAEIATVEKRVAVLRAVATLDEMVKGGSL